LGLFKKKILGYILLKRKKKKKKKLHWRLSGLSVDGKLVK